jgi:antirestriction protein ArdC
MKNDTNSSSRQDVYTRITSQIVASLEQGVRPWVKPWNAEHAAGRITQPLRFNLQPYSGINILSLWMSAAAQGFAAPIWMTFRQAIEVNAHVRKGERGSLVVYANAITRTERDDKTGEDVEREIPYLKGYTVFNVEQIDGLPDHYYAKAAPKLDPVARVERAENFFAASKATIRHGAIALIMRRKAIMFRCHRLNVSAMLRAITPLLRMNSRIMPPAGLCRTAVSDIHHRRVHL